MRCTLPPLGQDMLGLRKQKYKWTANNVKLFSRVINTKSKRMASLTAHCVSFKMDFPLIESHWHLSANLIRPLRSGFGQWSSHPPFAIHSGWRTKCGQLVETCCGCWSNRSQNKATRELTLNATLNSLCWWTFPFSYNKAWRGTPWVTTATPGSEEHSHLELSTMYCTILSKTFSKRAVRTQMCLMACAERGWGGRLVVEEPCLLRGSWLTLWVLLLGTKGTIPLTAITTQNTSSVFLKPCGNIQILL